MQQGRTIWAIGLVALLLLMGGAALIVVRAQASRTPNQLVQSTWSPVSAKTARFPPARDGRTFQNRPEFNFRAGELLGPGSAVTATGFFMPSTLNPDLIIVVKEVPGLGVRVELDGLIQRDPAFGLETICLPASSPSRPFCIISKQTHQQLLSSGVPPWLEQALWNARGNCNWSPTPGKYAPLGTEVKEHDVVPQSK